MAEYAIALAGVSVVALILLTAVWPAVERALGIGPQRPAADTPTPVASVIATPAAATAEPRTEVPVASVVTERQPDGTYRSTIDPSSRAIGGARLALWGPSTLDLGASGVVTLLVEPASASGYPAGSVVPNELLTPAPGDFHSEADIAIYPFMLAELRSGNLDVSPQGPVGQLVLSDRPSVWTWTLTPRAEGPQPLVLALAAPASWEGSVLDRLRLRVEKPVVVVSKS